MSNKTKNILFATSAALTVSVVAPVAVDANTIKFSDVKETNSHAEAIVALSERKVINGYKDGTFKPSQKLSRSNVVKMLGKFLVAQGYEIPSDYATKVRFNDVKTSKDDELKKYAAVVYDTGIFKGSQGNLMPNDPITRENIALVLTRLLSYETNVNIDEYVQDQDFDSNVKDLEKARKESRNAIQTIEYFGVTVVEQFDPKGTTTRGQFSSFLYRLLTNVLENEDKLAAIKGEAATEGKPEEYVTAYKNLTDLLANAGKITATASTDGKDVASTEQWATAEAIATFEAAKTAATAVLSNEEATAEQLQQAQQQLQAAIDAFEAALQPGSKLEEGEANKAALTAALAAANKVQKVAVSTDGKDVVKADFWTTKEALDNYEAALQSATKASADKEATQEQIDAAVALLNEAVKSYEAAKKAGIKDVSATEEVEAAEKAKTQAAVDRALTFVNELPAGEEKTALLNRLLAIQKELLAAAVATVPATLHTTNATKTGELYTSAATKTALEKAQAEAKTASENQAATVEQLKTATTNLTAAVSAYNADVKIFAAAPVVDSVALNYEDKTATAINEIGTIQVGVDNPQFSTVALGALTVIDADIIATDFDALTFEVAEGESVDMELSVMNNALLALGGYQVMILKLNEAGTEYEVMEEKTHTYAYLSALGIPIQTQYDFTFTDITKGEYAIVAGASDVLNIGIASGVTTKVTAINKYDALEVVNKDLAPKQGKVELATGAAITAAKATKTATTTNVNTAATVVEGAHGTLTIDASGNYSYKSQGGQDDIAKVDTFELTAKNGDKTATQTLHIRHNILTDNGAVELLWDDANQAADAKTTHAFDVKHAAGPVAVKADGVTEKTIVGSADLQKSSDANQYVLNPEGAETIYVQDENSVLTFRPYIPVNTTVKYSIFKAADDIATATPVYSTIVDGIKLPTIDGNNIHVTGLESGAYKIVLDRQDLTNNRTMGVQNVVVRDVNYALSAGTTVAGQLSITNNNAYGANLYIAQGGEIELEGTTFLKEETISSNGKYGTLTMQRNGQYTYELTAGNRHMFTDGETFNYRLIGVDGKPSAVKTLKIEFKQDGTINAVEQEGVINVSTLAKPVTEVSALQYTVKQSVAAVTVVDASLLG